MFIYPWHWLTYVSEQTVAGADSKWLTADPHCIKNYHVLVVLFTFVHYFSNFFSSIFFCFNCCTSFFLAFFCSDLLSAVAVDWCFVKNQYRDVCLLIISCFVWIDKKLYLSSLLFFPSLSEGSFWIKVINKLFIMAKQLRRAIFKPSCQQWVL